MCRPIVFVVHKLYLLKLQSVSNFAVVRSIRETVAAAERKAHQEEEIVGQEVYPEPILQRVIYV